MTTPFGAIWSPWWDDRDLFIVGGGPSLRGRDMSGLRKRGRVLAVNRAFELIPCDAVFSLDLTFIKNRRRELEMAARRSEVILAVPDDYSDGLVAGATYVKRIQGKGVSFDPRAIINGLNSGYGAVNVAILKRALRIYLLGFDLVAPATGEPGHWHDGYDWNNGSSRIYYSRWAQRFDEIARDVDMLGGTVQIINANPSSAIRCFPFTSYEDLGL